MSRSDTGATPRIWMNVTTSVNWTRPPVGIIRVEQELYKTLSELLGDRLRPCILSDGKFVRYKGSVVHGTEADTLPSEDEVIWPDPSYDFPPTGALELLATRSTKTFGRRRNVVSKRDAEEIQFGDILLSVGLDWDWDRHGLDKILYELKTKKDVKIISCCYDLIPVLYPQYCVGAVAAKFTEYFTNLSWSSSAMLCISRRSEADYKALAAELGMPEVPTKVMLLGNKLPERGDDISQTVRQICESQYLLFVSTIERRKNHEVIYKALHILGEQGRLDADLKVVFVGMPGWGVGDLLKDIDLDPVTRNHIVQINQANDAELRALYENCDFFLYPSFYEGWGLPVAEALALGKFVIASDRGSIPEVGGDLVEYVDPWNASAWADAIWRNFSNPELVERRSERIRKEYRPLGWDQAAATVLELIDTVKSQRKRRLEFEPGYDLQTQVGVRYGPRLLSKGNAGVLSYGPYQPLPAGKVVVSLELETNSPEPGRLSVKFTGDKGRSTFAKEVRRLPAGKEKKTLKFGLDIDHAVEDFEAVVYSHKDFPLAVTRLDIHLQQDVS